MSRRLRVLLSAYACEPNLGSEPGVGWNQALQAARFHEVWVLTRSNNRPAIESELARRPLPHAHWIYYDLPRCLRFWKRGQRGIHFYYYLWQLGAYRLARRLQESAAFDLVHHVTFVNFWTPSLLALLPIPFLWGPVGGGESAPRSFWATFGFRGRVFEILRAAARWGGYCDPLVRLTARRARLALATTRETAAWLRRLGCASVRLLGATALSEAEFEKLSEPQLPARQSVRLLSVGRLLHWKGYHLALEAFARLKGRFPQATYWVIGDGPERRRLAVLAGRLRLGSSVRFLGSLPRSRTLALLARGDVLVHPSLHESGGWACVEAMACGLPVVCLQIGGPAVLISEDCGILVPAASPGQAVEQMAGALEKLARDGRLRRAMGEAGRTRARELFSWDGKGEALQGLYRQCAGSRKAGGQ